MPCSDQHFIPILDELRMREEGAWPPPKRRGGARPGAGAPKGNLNALKHGRYSRHQRDLLEALLETMPEARDALIALAKHNRKRQTLMEERLALIAIGLLQRTAQIVYNQENNQSQDNQQFLNYLNAAIAEMQSFFEKQSPRLRGSIKREPA